MERVQLIGGPLDGAEFALAAHGPDALVCIATVYPEPPCSWVLDLRPGAAFSPLARPLSYVRACPPRADTHLVPFIYQGALQ